MNKLEGGSLEISALLKPHNFQPRRNKQLPNYMSYSYRALALLPPHATASIPEVADSLELNFQPSSVRFPIPDIRIKTDHIELTWSDWSLWLSG